MKKITALLLCLVLLAAMLAGCAQETPAPTTPDATTPDASNNGTETKTLVIGVAYQDFTNEFTTELQLGVQKAAKELNVELVEVDGKGLAENQLSQIENFITQGVDGIILNPYDADGCAPAVTAAKEAGIPIVVVNAKTSNVDEADAFIGSDDVIGGEMEMQYVAEQLGGKGTIVIMSGMYGNSAQIDRQQGIENVLAKYPDIKVFAEQTGNWVRDEGMTLMENWLQTGEQIDAVVAHNDQMALGALQAIEEAKPENPIITIGIDAIADAVNSVANGGMTATILQDGQGQGASALETLLKVINGESFEKTVNIPFILITKDNVAEYQ